MRHVVLALGMVAGAGWTCGQEAPAAGGTGAREQSEAVVRGARLSFVSGSVMVQRADNTGEDAPVANMPLYAGNRLVTGDDGQAEVEFEDGSVVRVTPRSALALDELGLVDGAAKTGMTLLSGLAYFELRTTAAGAYRVGAGGVGMVPVENATVRVSLDGGPAEFSVLTGSVRLEKEKGFSAEVRSGQSLRADAKDDSRYDLSAEVAEQSWDGWNEERDRAAADEADRRTTARDGFAGAQGYGWSDMDANGTWYDVPGQGQLWQPDVADEGFDPYAYGDWVYGNVGYVFVSGYSWGWTPYRCGRWNYFAGFGWGWMPGVTCGSYGFGAGGWGGIRIGKGPVAYRPIGAPVVGPGGVHPIVKVLGKDGPRPPVRTGGPATIAGVSVLPLRAVGGGVPRSGSMVGQALHRDFAVDRKTGMPVLGVSGVLRPVAGETVGGMVSKPVEGKDAGDVKAGVREGNAAGRSGAGAVPAAGRTVASPVRGVLAPAPVRVAPVPVAPAPVVNPARVAPAPAPAPAAAGSKPKG